MSLTASDAISQAFGILNVFLAGATVPAVHAQRALTILNAMIGTWAQTPTLIPVVAREVFALTAGQGGPSHPYTIGPGGDLNTDKPPSQASITGAGLLMGGTSPAIEIPRAVYTDDMYEALQVKELSNALFTAVYYSPTFSSGFGTVQLWPVPDTALHALVLYLRKQISKFADLTTVYQFPEGYEEAIPHALALRLSAPYGRTMPAEAMLLLRTSMATVKASNLKLRDLAQDLAFTHNQRYGYNIMTGTGGGAT